MRRAAIILAVTVALVPATADANTRMVGPAFGQRYIDRAKVFTPPETIVLHAGVACPAIEGDFVVACSTVNDDYGPGNNIWMWLIDDERERRLTLYHELGHHFDWMFPAVRQRLRLGPEEFADGYANCAMGRRWGPRRNQMWFNDLSRWDPSPRRFKHACTAMRRRR